MSQVSYGTITIVDTTDIERIYMVYAKSVSNTIPPSDELTWSESIASAPGEGDFIWQKTVVEKAITEEKTYSDPVCVTGSSGQGVEKIINYYCNYGQGQPEEDYSGWQLEIPEYDGNKPNYWTKVVVIYSDDTREDFQASGTIATFENEKVGVFDSLEVALSPIQDLHGYDRPWVGGGGASKIPFESVIEEGWTRTLNGITATFSKGYMKVTGTSTSSGWTNIVDLTPWASPDFFYLPAGTYSVAEHLTIKGYVDGTYANFSEAGRTVTQQFNVMGFYIAVRSGETVDWNIPMMFVSGSTRPTAYAPYSNICPISGWDSVDVTRTGKNLLKPKYSGRTHNGVTYVVNDDGTITASGTASGTSYAINNISTNRELTSYLPAGTYRLTGGIDASKQLYLGGLYDDGTAFTTVYDRGSGATYTFTKGAWVYPQIVITNGTTINATFNIQFELGTTPSDYEPYDGQTITTTLPQTVYGGTLDVVSGVLTVDRAMVDLGTLNWTKRDANNVFYAPFTGNPERNPTAQGYKYISSVWVYAENVDINAIWNRNADGLVVQPTGISSTSRIYAHNSVYDDADATAFKTAMNGVQLCYELATPTTIQLTPQQIDSLLGRNNVWSDGVVEVEGHTISKKDIMIYKDNGLTDVANKSAEANTSAAEALEKANDGIISTTQLWYQTNGTSAPNVPSNHSQVDQGTVTYNNWRSVRPNNSVDSYKYYYYCYEYLHGDGTYTYSAEAILDTSNLSQYQIDQLQVRIKKIWSNSTGSYMASGIGANEVDIDNSSTYGFNSKSTTTGVSFNYNAIPLTSLGTDGIKLYSPTLTNGVITGSRLDATLNTNGLILNKGGIKAGEGTSNFIYLSTDPYGNYSINGSSGISDWKQIIGTKFGVRADGTLYASNANISGAIDATSFIAKSYTGTTLNRQMSLGADGLKLMDGSGTILSQIDGLASTIGKTSGAHFIIDADGQRFYASDGTTQLANIGYGPGTDSGGGTSNAPYYTLGRRDGTVGNYSTAEGYRCEASGYASHAEGFQATASGSGSHAEGNNTNASGMEGHAEGASTTASGGYSHAEGNNTTANGGVSHAEGQSTTASGTPSHAEGYETTASGYASHAEGYGTTASGAYSHAQNRFTVATEYNQTVIGKYNSATVSGSGTDDDPYVYTNVGNYALIIGNGTANTTNDRSNALTVDWNGDISRYTGWDGSSIPSAENGKHYEALDTSGRWVGRVSSIVYSGSSSRSGQVGTLIRARHPSAPNNPNTIGIYVDDTGAMDYTISSPSAFRSALGIAVAVVGTGSSNGWVWRKYSDNTFDAWYSGTATTAINSVVGSLYQSGSNLTLTMPSGIGATSVLYGDVNLITSSYGVWTYIITLNSTTFSYRGMSALSRASASYTVKAYVRGAYS